MTEEPVSSSAPQWLTQFNTEYYGHAIDASEDDPILQVVKRFLQSTDGFLVEDAADEIEDCLNEIFDNGSPSEIFISGFYHQICILARCIPFDSHEQIKLVQLLRELHNLPVRPFKVWNETFELWAKEPLFRLSMDEEWNHRFPYPSLEKTNGEDGRSLSEICDQWVNFSSFLARIIAAGLKNGLSRAKYPSIACRDALENVTTGPRRDCLLRVATQYILISGHCLAEDKLNGTKDKLDPRSWKLWTEKFREISQTHGDPSLAAAAKEAYERMTALNSEFGKAPSASSYKTASVSTDSDKANGVETGKTTPDTIMDTERVDVNMAKTRKDVGAEDEKGCVETRADAESGSTYLVKRLGWA